MINAAIFDLDGTLVHFKIDYVKVREEVERYLACQGAPIESLVKQPVFVTLDKVINYLSSDGFSDGMIARIKADVERIVFKYELKAAEETSLKPNVKETLREIKNSGVKTGLFTINNRYVTELILNRNSIAEYFNAVVTREDTPKIKPYAEHFLTVIDLLEVEPKETLVIGDTIYDFQAPKRLGAIGVGVEGLYDGEYLRLHAHVDYVIKDISEVLGIIKHLNAD